ncbi:MAG: ribonuclease H-like domain-containing protein [Chthonomonas sp.]|nr:ribonuclease H-like domain-containing protein [Chthonomonas sp.]
MLTRTFSHIQGIGRQTEAALWAHGCETWDDFLAEPDRYSVGGASRSLVIEQIRQSKQALEAKHHQYFAKTLGLAESWRAWQEFKDSCLYLDIETDGTNSSDSITTIGAYDGSQFVALIKGHDLERFRDLITNYSMIVSFNGFSFDVPVLQRRFRDVVFDHIHLDLMLPLKRLGYRGGLKKIEAHLGIQRSPETAGLTGRDAIWLWRRYLRGDESAMETLIAYNREDCVNMERLAEVAYDGMKRYCLGPTPSLFSKSAQ